jgi:hypothetical protein
VVGGIEVPEPLRVDPAQLRMTAESLSSHAEWFLAKYTQTEAMAGHVTLGASKAAAALPAMLAEWQTTGQRFAQRHVQHADGHRVAAEAYTRTDTGASGEIEAAGRTVSP